MPVKDSPVLKPSAPEANVENDVDDPLNAPGFHVLANGSYCGTYVDREQAEAYITGQLDPQDGVKGEIVEGPSA